MSIAQICSNHSKMMFFNQMSLNNVDNDTMSEQNTNLWIHKNKEREK